MMMPDCPILTTKRLVLRGPTIDDADLVSQFLTDADRSAGFGGPLSADDAWRWFASMVGHWCIHGYGFWTVQASGTPVGIVGLWNPKGWPEPELGWVLFNGYEGHGYAVEAAHAVRAYAYGTLGMTTLTSNIVPFNEKSKVVARKLGATFERIYENPNMGTDELWRHPAPQDVA